MSKHFNKNETLELMFKEEENKINIVYSRNLKLEEFY